MDGMIIAIANNYYYYSYYFDYFMQCLQTMDCRGCKFFFPSKIANSIVFFSCDLFQSIWPTTIGRSVVPGV